MLFTILVVWVVVTTVKTDWGPVLFAVLVPACLVILGATLRTSYRLGKLAQKVDDLADRVGGWDRRNEQRYRNRGRS